MNTDSLPATAEAFKHGADDVIRRISEAMAALPRQTPTGRTEWATWQVASRKVYDLQDEAAEHFAALNGWRRSERDFDYRKIAGWSAGQRWTGCTVQPTGASLLDHVIYFRRDRKPVAVATQPYDPVPIGEVRNIVGHFGLTALESPVSRASFHYPDGCRFIVFVPEGVTVRWLPEQEAVS